MAMLALTGAVLVAGCGAAKDHISTTAPAVPVAALPGTIVAVEQPDPQTTTAAKVVVVGPGGALRTIAAMKGRPHTVPFVSVSPDGRTVAYDDIGHGLRLVDIDGANDRAIATPRGGGSPAWSRDGRQLAFDTAYAYADGQHGVIFTHDVASGRTRRLTPRGEDQDQFPNWLPDGRIVFQRDDGSTTHLDVWVMNANGSHRRQLTRERDLKYMPKASPDGRFIGVGSFHETTHGFDTNPIEVIDLHGRKVHKLAGGDNPDTLDDWSPDATQLLVDSTRAVPAGERAGSEDYGLWLLPVDGGAARPVALGPGRATLQNASWSPGG